MFGLLGGRCTHYTISLPSMDISRPSFKVCVHPVDHQSPLALSAPLCDLCVSALVDSCPGPALLRSTLMSNPILAVSSFSPRSRSASHEYPKVCLLDRIILPFKATGGQFFSHKKTHSMDLLRSRFVSLAFLCSLTPFCLCPSRLSLNILIHPIQEFICRSSRLLGSPTGIPNGVELAKWKNILKNSIFLKY